MMLDFTALAILLRILGSALLVTLAVELAVAALYRVGWRGLAVVALVNVITNPIMNLLLIITVGIVGFPPNSGGYVGPTIPDAVVLAGYAAPLLFEVAVVFVECELMVWAFQGTAGDYDRLLGLSIVMNVSSAVIGVVLAILVLLQGPGSWIWA
jgi:hypothetical protein